MVDVTTARELSKVSGAPQHFFELLRRQAEIQPQKEALVYGQSRLSYGELMQRVAAVGKQLQDAGVKPQEKIGVLFPNHPDYVAAFFAASGLGLTIVPINPLLKSDEIAHIMSDSEASTLLLHESALDEALKAAPKAKRLTRIFVSREQKAEAASTASSSRNAAECESLPTAGGSPAHITTTELTQERKPLSSVNWHGSKIDEQNDLALLVYTSGTTGKPKGAMLTHHNMLSIFPERLDIFDITEKDKTLAALPMCHIYGITILMVGTLSRGGTLVVMPKFEAAGALKLIESEKVTLLPLVPAMYHFALMELAKHTYDTSSVRICFSGAAPLAPELIKELEAAFTAVLIEGFAMTETSCVATINPMKGARKAGSVGPAVPGVQIRIVDDSGKELPAGAAHVGEISIKGPNIMRGYYNQPEENKSCIRDGWFASGDLAYKDEDGYIYIVGRKKEMIIRGGANIYPREIEEVLLKLEQVAEAAVIGVPDKLMGERVKAVLVLKTGKELNEDQVKSFCAERLAEYKVPRLVEFRDGLPRNSTGKVLKRLLSQQ